MPRTFAFSPCTAPMPLSDRAHDEKAEASSSEPRREGTGDAIEALKDSFQLRFWNSGALVFDSECHEFAVQRFGFDRNFNIVSRVFDGVVKEI